MGAVGFKSSIFCTQTQIPQARKPEHWQSHHLRQMLGNSLMSHQQGNIEKNSKFNQHLILFHYTLSCAQTTIFSTQYNLGGGGTQHGMMFLEHMTFIKTFLSPNISWETQNKGNFVTVVNIVLAFYFFFPIFYFNILLSQKKNRGCCLEFQMSALERLFNSGPG